MSNFEFDALAGSVLTTIGIAAAVLALLYLLGSAYFFIRMPDLARKNVEGLSSQEQEELNKEIDRMGKLSRWLTLVAAIGGLVGLTVAFIKGASLLPRIFRVDRLGSPISVAFAQSSSSASHSSMDGFLPYFGGSILVLMAVAFLVALGVLFLVPDTKENQARLKAADNIVKTFGGFFTGLATTIIH